MTASILARVASFTNGDWLITRETVLLRNVGEPRDVVDGRPAAVSARGCLQPRRIRAQAPGCRMFLVLGMLVVLAPPLRAKAAAVYASTRGWTKEDQPL